MKLNYSRKTQNGFVEAGVDLDLVFHYQVFESEGERSVELMLNLPTVESIQQVPVYNPKTGSVKEYRPTKVQQMPVVTLTKEEDIDTFLTWWNS